MALLFLESFDSYGGLGTNVPLRYETPPDGNRVSLSSSNGRPGSSLFYTTSTSSANTTMGKRVPGSNCLIIGLAWRVTTTLVNNLFFYAANATGNEQFRFQVNTDSTLSLLRGSDQAVLWKSEALTPGYWVYLEVKYRTDAANGDWEVRLNGITKASSGGISTRNGSVTGMDYVTIQTIGNAGGAPFNPVIDDWYIANTSGAVNSNFLGPLRVQYLSASGVGTYSEWTPSGAAPNFECVNDVTLNSDTDFVFSSTQGARDLYAMSDIVTGGASIKGVQVLATVKKDDVLARQFWPLIRSAAVDASGTAWVNSLTTSYVQYTGMFETDPNTGAAWTSGAVNGMQAGTQVVA
jgi:hypothetical protein